MSENPEAIRERIEETRRDLSRNVDALAESVTPGNIARRQGDKLKDAVGGLKDRIMGSDDDAEFQARYAGSGYAGQRYDDGGPSKVDELKGQASDLKDQASARLSDAQGAVQGAPYAARRKAQGNPLAAGLIALGAGWLLGSLLPSSQKEQEASLALKEKAAPILEEGKSIAQEAVENLKPAAQDAAESLKASATSAVENVKAEGQGAAEAVKAHGQEAAANVKAEGQSVASDVKAEGQGVASDVKSSAQDAKDTVQEHRES